MDHSSSEQKAPKSAARLFVTLLLVCVLLLGAGGVAFTWLAVEPKHRVTGTIHIAPTVPDTWASEPKPYDREAYAIFMNTQALRLASDESGLRKVVDDLASRELTFFSQAKTPAPTEGKLSTPCDVLAQAIRNEVIRIAPIPDTELLEVTMVSEDEEEAKTIVNSFLRNYVGQYGIQCTNSEHQTITILENQRNELRMRIMQGEAAFSSLARDFGPIEPYPTTGMESQWRNSLYGELSQVQVKRLNLETAVEEGAVAVDPEELLSARRDAVDSDPLIRALAQRIADVQVDLAVVREKEPNDTTSIQRQQRIIDGLDQQLATLRQTRREQFEAELSDTLKRQSEQRLAKAKRELQRVKAHEDRLQRAVREQEEEARLPRVASPNVEIQDRQFHLELDRESYEQICRRLHDIEMKRDRRPRVRIASLAEIRGMVDPRRRWTLMVLGAAVVLSVILLIVRRVVKGRIEETVQTGETT